METDNETLNMITCIKSQLMMMIMIMEISTMTIESKSPTLKDCNEDIQTIIRYFGELKGFLDENKLDFHRNL
jgi:hypothetical protein